MSEEKLPMDVDTERLRDLVQKVGAELREHCDSVVIVCTLSEGDATDLVYDKRGNHWAGIASMGRYLEMMETERMRKDSRDEE